VCEFEHELAATSASAQIAQATLVPFILAATGTVVVMIFWACSSFVAIQRTILGTGTAQRCGRNPRKNRVFLMALNICCLKMMALSLYQVFFIFFLSFDGHNWGYIPFSDTPNALNQPIDPQPKTKKTQGES
jgi:hypothetical protein